MSQKKGVVFLTYTEWYKKTYNDEWTDNHAVLNSVTVEYEKWCEENNLTPIWDG
jgi:hypothetical protein